MDQELRRKGLSSRGVGILIGAGLFLCGPVLAESRAVTAIEALELIDAEDIGRHLTFLTSEKLAGRNTPMHGLDLAAEYLGAALEESGIRPASQEQRYYHRWETRALVADPSSALTLHTPGNLAPRKTFRIGEDFVPIVGSAERSARGRVVFAGYGITSKSDRYDDYRGKSIHGKIAMVLSHEPRERSKGKRFDGPKSTKHSSFLVKAENAAAHGARGLIVVTDPLHHEETSPIRYQLPRMAGGGEPLRPAKNADIPVVHVSLEVAEEILGEPILPLQKQIDRTLRNRLQEIQGVEVQIRVKFDEAAVKTQNVVGLHQGSDPILKEEFVVIGAHYDHVGTNDRGDVHHGADDNGSGVVALLEVAEAFGASRIETKRSVLFLFFSGEEKGLVGSKQYVENPSFPLEDVVAMLNMDMIGRNDSKEIEVLGSAENPALYGTARRAAGNPQVRLHLKKGDTAFFKRSDHYPFHLRGVPTLFFFSGLHEDYHKPSDTPEKVDKKKIRRVARMIFLTSVNLANQS